MEAFDFTKTIHALKPAKVDDGDDVETILFTWKGSTYPVRRCKVCGAQGGSSLNCDHKVKCKHYTPVYVSPCESYYQLHFPSFSKNLNKKSVFPVMMREYAISSEHGRLVGSHSAGPCFILALRNRITGLTVISHIDALTTNSVRTMRTCLGVTSPSSIDVYLTSGNVLRGDEHIVDLLYDLQDCRMVYFDILNTGSSKSLVIDSETGEYYANVPITVFKDIPEHVFHKSPMRFTAMLMIRSPLTKAKCLIEVDNASSSVEPNELPFSKFDLQSIDNINHFKRYPSVIPHQVPFTILTKFEHEPNALDNVSFEKLDCDIPLTYMKWNACLYLEGDDETRLEKLVTSLTEINRSSGTIEVFGLKLGFEHVD